MNNINRNLFLLTISIFVSLLFGCNNNETQIESMSVLYYNYTFERPVAVHCDEIKKKQPSMIKYKFGDDYWIDNHGVLDTIISDKSILKKISKELENAKWDTVSIADARIVCKLKYKNGNIKELCICGEIPREIKCDNKVMKNKNRLLYLIKSSIDYYKWMGDDVMVYSDELFDSSFQRTKVKSISGKIY